MNFKTSSGFSIFKTEKLFTFNNIPLFEKHKYFITDIIQENCILKSFSLKLQLNEVSTIDSVEISNNELIKSDFKQYKITSHKIHLLENHFILVEGMNMNFINFIKDNSFFGFILNIPKFNFENLIQRFVIDNPKLDFFKLDYTNISTNIRSVGIITDNITSIKNILLKKMENYIHSIEIYKSSDNFLLNISLNDKYNICLLDTNEVFDNLLDYLCVIK